MKTEQQFPISKQRDVSITYRRTRRPGFHILSGPYHHNGSFLFVSLLLDNLRRQGQLLRPDLRRLLSCMRQLYHSIVHGSRLSTDHQACASHNNNQVHQISIQTNDKQALLRDLHPESLPGFCQLMWRVVWWMLPCLHRSRHSDIHGSDLPEFDDDQHEVRKYGRRCWRTGFVGLLGIYIESRSLN